MASKMLDMTLKACLGVGFGGENLVPLVFFMNGSHNH